LATAAEAKRGWVLGPGASCSTAVQQASKQAAQSQMEHALSCVSRKERSFPGQ
jgi:hypothetical protein